jgi:hypothetical protein
VQLHGAAHTKLVICDHTIEMGIHFLIKNVTEEGLRFLSINVTQMRFIDSWENVTIDFLSWCSSSEAESMASESQLDQALTL